MDVPLELSFHNMSNSPQIEDDVRNHVAKLDRLYDHLIGCRVAVEATTTAAPRYDVHIELSVPGTELVVSRANHGHPELRAAIRDAFHAAERQLKAFKARISGTVLPHETVVVGQVTQLNRDQDFGFIQTNTGGQLYFHRNSLIDGGFDDLADGTVVQYVQADGDTGPTAIKVWASPASREA